MLTRKKVTPFWALVLALFWAVVFSFAQDFSKLKVKTVHLSESVYLLYCAGGCIGVSAGEDGVMLIDTSYAEMYTKIKDALEEISDKPVRYVISTHQHFDHVNGNELFAQSGATIVAHANVRQGMETDWVHPGFPTVPAYPKAALPVMTFDKSLTLHFNGEDIHIFHWGDGHTDGDSIVHFQKANVIHMGDLFFNGGYPFIDVPHGGTIDGIIATLDEVIGMITDKAKVIPGHGLLSNRAELREYRDMLATIRDRIRTMIDKGKSLEEVIAAKPTSDFDRAPQAMMPPDAFVRILFEDLLLKSRDMQRLPRFH